MSNKYIFMIRILIYLTCVRLIPHWLYYLLAMNKQVISEDLLRNINLFIRRNHENDNQPTFYEFCRLLTFYRMVRNIYYARVANKHKLYAKFLGLLAKPLPLLDISSTAEIGGGLIVQHGYATIIAPRKIGRNCWVNQGVTIGYTNDNDCPTLGDNVTIYAGAKVLGDVYVGNNVIVAANAVVVKDVPDNAIVGGVPAKIIKYRDV
jgi:serine O-acetyltransferase